MIWDAFEIGTSEEFEFFIYYDVCKQIQDHDKMKEGYLILKPMLE